MIKITFEKNIIDIAIKKMKKYKKQMKKDISKPSGRDDEYISRLVLEDDKNCYELVIRKMYKKHKID